MGYSALLLGFSWLVINNSFGFAAVLPMNHIMEVNNSLIVILKIHTRINYIQYKYIVIVLYIFALHACI